LEKEQWATVVPFFVVMHNCVFITKFGFVM